MNKLFSTFLFLCLFDCMAIAQNTTLHIKLSPELSGVEQTVYWVNLDGNEYLFLDSAVIKKGQHDVVLKADLEEDDFCSFSWLTFSKIGPVQMIVRTCAGEKMSVDVSDGMNAITPKIEGSIASMEYYYYQKEVMKIRKKIDHFQDLLSASTDSLLSKQYIDSIDFYNKYLKVENNLNLISNTNSPNVFHLSLLVLRGYLPEEKSDSLIVEMKKRFPDNKKVQAYPNLPVRKATANSRYVKERIDGIISRRLGVEPAEFLSLKKAETKIVEVDKKQQGDVVQGLSYEGLAGTRIPLRDIPTPYILLDFWASWCGPCRIKFPEVKKVLAANRDSLTVYAITLDTSEKAWRESIRYSHIEEFVNVMPKGAEADTMQAMFGIEAIPYNVLLNRERKIVATNIYGTDLIMKLKE